MRPSLLASLLNVVSKNLARGYKNLNFFEIGKGYLGNSANEQPNLITGIRFGKTTDKNIYHDDRIQDIFDVKRDLIDVLEILGFSEEAVQTTRDAPDYYHPQRSGTIRLGKTVLASFGELHPTKMKAFGISDKVNVFELYLDNLPQKRAKNSTAKKVFDVSNLQPVTRDFSFILDKDIDANKLIKITKGVNKDLITQVNIFDIYEGENIGENKKSIAFNVVMQPRVTTMTSEEIDSISELIINKVKNELNGVLRDKI